MKSKQKYTDTTIRMDSLARAHMELFTKATI